MIPDIKLHTIIKSCLSALRVDYEANGSTESDTILYHLLNDSQVADTGKFQWFEQAKEIFINRDSNHPKYLDTNLFFNRERASIPTIHIMISGESKGMDGIAMDEGYNEAQVIGGDFRPVLNRQFNVNANIIVTSDNSFETVIIYHVLRSMLISISTHIQLSGFINPNISGRDITLSQEIAPNGVFARTINFTAGYELDVPEVVLNQIVSQVYFEMSSINDEELDDGSVTTGVIDADSGADDVDNPLPST